MKYKENIDKCDNLDIKNWSKSKVLDLEEDICYISAQINTILKYLNIIHQYVRTKHNLLYIVKSWSLQNI